MSAGSKKNTPIKATKLSVDEISTVTQSGTLKLSENLEIGGDGLILSDLLSGSTSKKIISLDSGNLVISTYSDGIRSDHEIILDTNNNISEILNSLNESAMNLEILSLDVSTSGTTGTTAPGDGNARIDGSLSVGTTIGHPSDPDLITLADGSVTFTGTTVIPTADINGGAIDSTTIGATTPAVGTFTELTVNDALIIAAGATITGDTANQITLAITGVSGQTANLLTIKQSSGTDKLVVDSSGVTTAVSLVATTADINGGSIDGVTIGTDSACTSLVATSLVATTADINSGTVDATIGATTPAAGTFTTLTANTSLTCAKSLILTPSVITSASIDDGTPTDLDESISIFYFDLNSTSAMYGIFAAGTTGQMINIFYDNHEPSGSLRIDFGIGKLRTGSGESRYLTFNITGQSASLMYISSTIDKWCVTNTGATVS